MQISLSETGKRFNRDWIFRKLSYHFEAGGKYAITGPNGSGKSTLLQVIGGAIVCSEGSVTYLLNSKTVDPEQMYRYIAIAAPYQELIEEMTLREFLEFHSKFKPWIEGQTVDTIMQAVNLSPAANRQIRYFSSGMKQRAKLAQAIFSSVPCLLLDEPCTNLDAEGIRLYQELIEQFALNRIVIVSSNDPQEYGFCKEVLRIMEFK
jgi:ABC-type multidrug transport system ATPase subunit